MSPNDLVERRAKLVALATRGEGGERDAAARALARFDARHPDVLTDAQRQRVDVWPRREGVPPEIAPVLWAFGLGRALSYVMDMLATPTPPKKKKRSKGRTSRKRSTSKR